MKKTKRGRTKRGRANGEGYLELKSNGVYLARWTYDGRRYAKSTGETTERAALKKLEEFTAPFRLKGEKALLENIQGRIMGVEAELKRLEDEAPAMAVSEAWAAYEESDKHPRSSRETLRGYETYWRKLAEWLAVTYPEITELRRLDEKTARQFCKTQLSGVSANTYNKHITFFRAMWKALEKEAQLTTNPWKEITKKQLDGFTRRDLTEAELDRVCAAVGGEMRLLFMLGIHAGLRLKDAVLLDWSKVDMARGIISLLPAKTAKRSSKWAGIPLNRFLCSAINELAAKSGFLMPGLAVEYSKDRGALCKRIQKIFESCGIDTRATKEGNARAAVEVGFHSLRHHFVSYLANRDVSLALVQDMVGHSNPKMTEHYFHSNINALKNAVELLPPIGATTIPAEGADASEAILERFKAILAELRGAGLLERAAEIMRTEVAK